MLLMIRYFEDTRVIEIMKIIWIIEIVWTIESSEIMLPNNQHLVVDFDFYRYSKLLIMDSTYKYQQDKILLLGFNLQSIFQKVLKFGD